MMVRPTCALGSRACHVRKTLRIARPNRIAGNRAVSLHGQTLSTRIYQQHVWRGYSGCVIASGVLRVCASAGGRLSCTLGTNRVPSLRLLRPWKRKWR